MRRRMIFSIVMLCGVSLVFGVAGIAMEACQPCSAFDRLDKQIRDGAISRAAAEQQFARLIGELDARFGNVNPRPNPVRWVMPLRGYSLAETVGDADQGYVAAGYDYFDGNRHGGHPSYDLFIHDRNQDSLDDRSGQPVTVVAVTGGVVVAAESAWEASSRLRGGNYLWIYAPAERRLFYYAHNRALLVKVGDRVEPGTPIATVGRSGFNAAKRRSPTHLHLTVLQIDEGRPRPVPATPLLKQAAAHR